MSSCLVFQEKNKVVIGADTAASISKDGIFYRVKDYEYSKLHVCANGIIFCSGVEEETKKVIEFLHDGGNYLSVSNVQLFLKSLNITKNPEFFSIEILAVVSLADGLHIYQLSEYNDFDVTEHNILDGQKRVLSAGYKTQQVNDLAYSLYTEKETLADLYSNVYTKVACEQIGGKVELYEIDSKSNIKFSSLLIKDPENVKAINIPGMSKHFLVADAICGRMIAGNQLTITNQNNNFTLDASGATLYNANFSIVSGDNKKRIYLDPTNGISVQTNATGTWKNSFYVDTLGNLQFAGNLSGASGTFSGTIQATTGILGGWTINNDGLYDTHGNYIYSNGNIKIGALTIAGSTATFSGNIYADKIFGEIVNNQIANGAVSDSKVSAVSAQKINTGTMSADRIYGGTINWAGASLGTYATGVPYLYADNYISLNAAGRSILELRPDYASLYNSTAINIGNTYNGASNPVINFRGTVQVNGASGQTITLTVSTPYGNMNLGFSSGILTSWGYV